MARILLIDDDEFVRDALRQALVLASHTVLEAANGKDGLKLFSRESVDLVITDIVMPEKEGLEVVIALQAFQPPVKIIAMSGYYRSNAADYLHIAKLLGAAKVLTKPFPNSVLLLAVEEMLATPTAPQTTPPPSDAT